MKNAIIVIGLLWLAKHLERAHRAASTASEIYPADPYNAVTSQWEVINGSNWGDFGPNAHEPGFAVAVGIDPTPANPCICRHG